MMCAICGKKIAKSEESYVDNETKLPWCCGCFEGAKKKIGDPSLQKINWNVPMEELKEQLQEEKEMIADFREDIRDLKETVENIKQEIQARKNLAA